MSMFSQVKSSQTPFSAQTSAFKIVSLALLTTQSSEIQIIHVHVFSNIRTLPLLLQTCLSWQPWGWHYKIRLI